MDREGVVGFSICCFYQAVKMKGLGRLGSGGLFKGSYHGELSVRGGRSG